MIVDKVKIYLEAGAGGEGSSSLMGGSSRKIVGSGGDGGKGGDIVLKISPHLYDLSKFKGNKKFVAKDGERGKEKNKKGKDAQELTLYIPSGTRVLDEEGGVIADLIGEVDKFLICRGGRGGKGNYKRTYTVPAQEGEKREVTLDYRIPNDVAILGLPNSGKTTLFNSLTGHNYKVADYPFTTTSCVWAETEYEFVRCAILDTPPVKKSKDSLSLPDENRFLRHIIRSKILILLSDSLDDFKNDFSALKEQISLFDPCLLKQKKIFYLLNKIDKIDKKVEQKNIITISAQKGIGIEALKESIFKNIK